MLISFLMGHSLQGVSARYTNELMIANSQASPSGAREDQSPDFRIARAHARRGSAAITKPRLRRTRRPVSKRAGKRAKPPLRPASIETGQERTREDVRTLPGLTEGRRQGKPSGPPSVAT